MRDYSIDRLQAERFILNYKIKGNEIIVNFAKKNKNKKDKYVIPYTIENEKKLLEKMKQQVLNSDKYCRLYVSGESSLNEILTYSLGTTLSFVLLSLMSLGNIFAFCVFSIPAVITSSIFTYSMYFKINSKRKLADIKKNQFFLENEQLFNSKPNTKSTKNIILGTKYKLDKRTNQIDFNLNSIHKLKYKELKLILENIKFEENLNFNYNNSIDVISNVNRKNKSLTKKIK